jgi:nitrate reductase assembly molybdenum cofactor insertion protein NarJ
VRLTIVDSLIQDLQKTILALEKMSESAGTSSEQVDELLDQLFQQKIDLLNARLNPSSSPYQLAAQAMKKAAATASKTPKEPARVQDLIASISDAISKVARLLDNFVASE